MILNLYNIYMVKVIAEIGINHNGTIDDCKKMMMLSKGAGV